MIYRNGCLHKHALIWSPNNLLSSWIWNTHPFDSKDKVYSLKSSRLDSMTLCFDNFVNDCVWASTKVISKLCVITTISLARHQKQACTNFKCPFFRVSELFGWLDPNFTEEFFSPKIPNQLKSTKVRENAQQMSQICYWQKDCASLSSLLVLNNTFKF